MQVSEINDAKLAWDRIGETGRGAQFVLCHGFSGSSHDFLLAMPALAEHRQVLALDHRGHGRSAKLGRLDAYSLELLAQDLIAWLEHVADAPVDLLGHSMGGRVVLDVLLCRPDLVRSVILMDTSADAMIDESSGDAEFMRSFLATYDPSSGLPDVPRSRGPEDDLIDERTPVEWRRTKAELDAAFDPFALKALGSELLDMGRRSLLPRLREIRCPTTVLAGASDPVFATRAPGIAASIDGSKLVIVDGAYHCPHLTHAAEWLAAVERHLAWS